MDDDKVKRFPVKPRTRELALELVHYDPTAPCSHQRCPYRIKEGEAEVVCGGCGVRLDPMFVLKQLAFQDSIWKQRQEAAVRTAKELHERVRTKCQHCGKMTRIRGV